MCASLVPQAPTDDHKKNKWIFQWNSINDILPVVKNFLSAVSQEMAHGFVTIPWRQNMPGWNGNNPGLHHQKRLRLWRPLAKWQLQCFGITKAFCSYPWCNNAWQSMWWLITTHWHIYCICKAIQWKRPRLLQKGALLLHDSTQLFIFFSFSRNETELLLWVWTSSCHVHICCFIFQCTAVKDPQCFTHYMI